jgi:hypothetical protein
MTVATTRIWVSCPTIFCIQFEPWPRIGRPPKHDVAASTVTEDWPRRVPVTQAEVDMFEAWFGDLFDELFGPCRNRGRCTSSIPISRHTDGIL